MQAESEKNQKNNYDNSYRESVAEEQKAEEVHANYSEIVGYMEYI